MSNLHNIFKSNEDWSKEIKEKDPEFFSKLSKVQNPQYLWIGCSDSRVPANQIMGLLPGEVFVHRNIANLVIPSDLNCLSVLQYAVEVLKVKDIIVCGHYDCGGIKAAINGEEYGLIDNWIQHIKGVSKTHADKLEGLEFQEKFDLLCELNVIEQVHNLKETTIVREALKSRDDLNIHGLIYSLKDGILKELSV